MPGPHRRHHPAAERPGLNRPGRVGGSVGRLAMFEWSEEQLAIRDAVRRFVEEEIKPNIDELEHGDTPPYEVIRKLYTTFGLDAAARDSFKRALERKTSGSGSGEASGTAAARGEGGSNAAVTLIPIIELCHYCP